MYSSLLITAGLASYAAASVTGTPTASLFLPFSDAGNLVASVITAAPSQTVYAIGCATPSGACGVECAIETSVTITEGPSTLAYVWEEDAAQLPTSYASNVTQEAMTVNCALVGGSSASQAVCTGVDVHNVSLTTTLGSSQISYVPVTITAGATKLASIASQATGNATGSSSSFTRSPTASSTKSGSASSASSSTGGAAPLSVAGYAIAGIAGVAAFGLL